MRKTVRAAIAAGVAVGAHPSCPDRQSALVVEHLGSLSLVQDAGRRALAAIGVPAAGPADPAGHRLVNRLVGNGREGAALEVLLSGAGAAGRG